MRTALSLLIFATLTAGFGVGLYFFLVLFSPQVVDILGFIVLYGLVIGSMTSFFMLAKVVGNWLFFKRPISWTWLSHGLVQSFLLSLIVAGFLLLEQFDKLNWVSGLLVVLLVLILEAFNEKNFRKT